MRERLVPAFAVLHMKVNIVTKRCYRPSMMLPTVHGFENCNDTHSTYSLATNSDGYNKEGG